MKVKDIFKKGKTTLSFEIFPPKPEYPLEELYNTVTDLKTLNPDYMSITYGAGGSNRDRTLEIAAALENKFDIETLVHLTCVLHTEKQIDDIASKLETDGIHNVLALRGDPPAGTVDFDFNKQNFQHAEQLIAYLKSKYDICTGAAAHPEGHPQCSRLSTDLMHLKSKVDAGADFLVTQLFFDNRVFYNFMEQARAIGISCPVTVGIMPVLNARSIIRMASMCGASIPARLMCDVLEKYQDNPDDLQKAGLEYAVRQIQDLVDNDVDGIHLYCMNKSAQAIEIIRQVSLRR